MTEVTVDGHTYRVGKLDAKTQFHVARRLGPAVLAVGAPLLGMLGAERKAETSDLLALAGPVAQAMALMSDADANYVIDRCMSVVARQQEDRWAPVATATGVFMFQDMEWVTLVRLTVEVLRENLGNFFQTAPDAGPSSASPT